MRIFKDFHSDGIIDKIINNTFIALIDKKKDFITSKDFHPISLTTSFYKIIVKSLVSRLKTTLPITISENHCICERSSNNRCNPNG